MKAISTNNAPHYKWGDGCDGWKILHSESLTVIQERMAPGTSEMLHFHVKSQQVFYILSGEAKFRLNGTIVNLKANEAIHVSPGTKHKISNESNTDLEFLVISEPPSHGDRENL